MTKLDRASGGALNQVRAAETWAQIAGESVLSHSCDAHLRRGEFVVLVDSPLWATELSALSEQYRVRLNEVLGYDAVRTVRFTVSKKVGERRRFEASEKDTQEFYEADTTASVPLSDSELAQVEASVAAIEDEQLRQVVLKATITDLEWKKGQRRAKTS